MREESGTFALEMHTIDRRTYTCLVCKRSAASILALLRKREAAKAIRAASGKERA